MQEVRATIDNSQICSKVNIGRLISRQGSVVCTPNIFSDTKRTYVNQPLSMLIDCNGKIEVLEEGIEASLLADFGNKTMDLALLAPTVSGNFPDVIAVRKVGIDKKTHRVEQSRKTEIFFWSGERDWAHELASARNVEAAFAFSELHYARKSVISSRMWKFENIYMRLIAANARCKLEVTVGNIETEPPI